jgi:hypothetical protein
MTSNTSRRVDIAVITIRDDENRAALDGLRDYKIETFRNRSYALGRVARKIAGDITVAVVRTPSQGPGPAQDTARDVIEDLDPAWLALVGIGGAIPEREFTLGVCRR